MRKMSREVIDDVLSSSLESSDIELGNDKVVNLLSKKVA
jgi:hypothetical protein